MTQPTLPGATLGILGGGQLGRMFAIAARQMGYRVRVLTDEADSPGAQLADESVVVDFQTLDQLESALRGVDVLTYETENLPLAFVARAAELTTLRPGLQLFQLSQHRWIEKTSLRQLNLPVGPFLPIHSVADLSPAIRRFNNKAVLKTTTGGYDGKGQCMIRDAQSADAAINVATSIFDKQLPKGDDWNGEPLPRLILEQLIEYEAEFSVIAARGIDCTVKTYGPILNHHSDHILDVSVCPAKLGDDSVTDKSQNIIRRLAEALDVVGVFCVEFFLTRDGQVVINEVAPRTHNSGHLTIEAHVTSQFAQQVRAIAGLPLGSTKLMHPAAMANLLGDVWLDRSPAWTEALRGFDSSLHLYGKQTPRAKRKMGHITVLAETAELAADHARRARQALIDPAK